MGVRRYVSYPLNTEMRIRGAHEKGGEEYSPKKMDEIRREDPEIEDAQRNIHLRLSSDVELLEDVPHCQIYGDDKANIREEMVEEFDFLEKRKYGRGGI